MANGAQHAAAHVAKARPTDIYPPCHGRKGCSRPCTASPPGSPVASVCALSYRCSWAWSTCRPCSVQHAVQPSGCSRVVRR